MKKDRKIRSRLAMATFISLLIHLAFCFLPEETSLLFLGDKKIEELPRLVVIDLPRESFPVYLAKTSVPEIDRPEIPLEKTDFGLKGSAPSLPRISEQMPALSMDAIPEGLINFARPANSQSTPTDEDSLTSVSNYITSVLDRVNSFKQYPTVARKFGQQGAVVLAFEIAKNGDIDGDVAVAESSGYGTLNKSAVRSVKRCAPFPPLPDYVSSTSLPLKLRIEYLLQE